MNFVWREGVKIKIELLGDTLEEMNTNRQREEWGGGGRNVHVILKSERKSHESDFHKISFFFMNNTPQ